MANVSECVSVHSLAIDDQCDFVASCEDCHRDEGFFAYIDVIFCGSHRPYLPLFVLTCWCLYLFGVLAIAANDYLCPALVAISKKLGLSQAVAGVTFLAIGNGAPDIIASFTAIHQDRSALVISELFGAGTFVTAVVAGYVFYCSKFTVDRFSFLRDVLFYMISAGLAFALFRLGQVSVLQAILFGFIYALYIILVLLRELLDNDEGSSIVVSSSSSSNLKDSESLLGSGEFTLRRPSGLNVHHQNAIKVLLQQQQLQLQQSPNSSTNACHLRSGSISALSPNSIISKDLLFRRQQQHQQHQHQAKDYKSFKEVESSGASDSTELDVNELENMSPVQELWIHIAPMSLEELRAESLLGMTWRTVALPIQVVLALTVPVVDYEHEKDNWCKPLNVLHCILSPLAILAIVFPHVEIFDVPLFVVILPGCLVLASLVVVTSKHDVAPRYHFAFALLAFVTAVCFIYAACRELMTLLRALGLSQNIDDSVLGLTVLAWGSSVGDLITNSTVAKQGYPGMAIAAAFAGPMLNLLIGFGLSFSVKLLQTHQPSMSVEFPSILFVLYAALNASLITSVVFLVCNRFRSSTAHAITLWMLYAIFVVTALVLTLHSDIRF